MNTKDYRYLDQLPDSSMLAADEVLALVRIARSTWYAGIKSGRYPEPTYIGPASPRWRMGTIRELAAGTYVRADAQQKAA